MIWTSIVAAYGLHALKPYFQYLGFHHKMDWNAETAGVLFLGFPLIIGDKFTFVSGNSLKTSTKKITNETLSTQKTNCFSTAFFTSSCTQSNGHSARIDHEHIFTHEIKSRKAKGYKWATPRIFLMQNTSNSSF